MGTLFTRPLRRRRSQLAYQVCSRPNVRWLIEQHDETVVERGKTVAKRWLAGGCRRDRSLSPASTTLTPWSVGWGRLQP